MADTANLHSGWVKCLLQLLVGPKPCIASRGRSVGWYIHSTEKVGERCGIHLVCRIFWSSIFHACLFISMDVTSCLPCRSSFYLACWLLPNLIKGNCLPVTIGSRQTIWRASIVMLTVAFIFLGAQSYAKDVAVIESEMVVTAKWVAANLPPGCLDRRT